jgi:hypothetical protein
MMEDESDDDDSSETDPTSSRPSIQLRHSSDDEDGGIQESYFDARSAMGASAEDVSTEKAFAFPRQFMALPSPLSKEADVEKITTKGANEWSPEKNFSTLGIEITPPPDQPIFEETHPPSSRVHNESLLETPKPADYLSLVKEDEDRLSIPTTKIIPPTPDASEKVATKSASASQSTTLTAVPRIVPMPTSPKQSRPSLYSQQSQSMINLPSMSPHRHTVDLKGKSPLLQPGDIQATPKDDNLTMSPSPQYTAAASPTLMRRMSLPDLNVPPPPYPIDKMATPRDEEGMEKLPPYTCGIHIEGGMMRKMEFSAPGVQAKDRSWKKQYFVLNGTRLCVYKNDIRRFPVKGQPQKHHVVDETTVDTSSNNVHLPPSAVGTTVSRIRSGNAPLSRAASRSSSTSTRSGGSSISASRSAPIVTGSARLGPGEEKLRPTASRDSAQTSSGSALQPPQRSSSRQSSRSNLTTSSSHTSHSHSSSLSHSHSHSHSHSLSLSAVSSTFHVSSNGLVRQYSLQNAESGLGTLLEEEECDSGEM